MNLPAHRMGVHFINIHGLQANFDYCAALKPSSIKIIDPDPNFAVRCMSWLDPNGVLVLRDHPLSEQKSDAVNDPVGTGIRHAEDWNNKLNTKFSALDRKRVVVCGINEPYVRDILEEASAVSYTTALLKRATELNVRVLALNLSVGWPRNHDDATHKDTPPDWTSFLPLEDLIIKNNGFLCVHEYWYDQPENGWGWLAGRINKCPMTKVPIIIGEVGMEKLVDVTRWNNEGQPHRGWLGNISPEEYANQLWRYTEKVNPNVFSVMPFTTDFGSRDWWTLDTLTAQPEILKQKRNAVWPNPYPTGGTVVTPPPVEPLTTGSDPNLFIVPIYTGKITGFYGQDYDYAHEGMDISAVVGTPIYAPYDGVCAWSDLEPSTYGNYIRLFFPQLKICTFYGHLSQRLVQTGNSVKQGQLIGYSGNTGNSSGPHIHFEVRAMNDDGSYKVWKPGQPLFRQNGRCDPLAFIAGWSAAGKTVREK